MKHFCAVSRKISFIGFWFAFVFLFLLLISCHEEPSLAKRQLGKLLFSDHRLAWNKSRSCASCHDPKLAFTDGYRRSVTPSGELVAHNAPSLVNVSQYQVFDWAHPLTRTLQEQLRRPLFATHPLELGLHRHWTEFVQVLNTDPEYTILWQRAYGSGAKPQDTSKIIECLIYYLNTLQSGSSSYDRWMSGDSSFISASARRGRKLFSSSRLRCSRCHGGRFFSNATLSSNYDSIYFNTGLYEKYPSEDPGLSAVTQQSGDEGRFRVPSLRNVTLTAPYMHDGSVSSLSEVIDIYSQGGRVIESGPYAGNGAKHPNRHGFVNGFHLTEAEKSDLLNFLGTLTDTVFLSNQNPSPLN